MTTYGRRKIDRTWYISSSFGSNRIYYIHSGDVFYMGTGSVEKLNVGHLYFFPQNLKFELEFDKNKPIDHTYFDFITTPPIKIDNFINIDLEKNETINAASKILFTLGEKYPRWFDKNYEKLIISYTQNLLTLIDKVHPIGTVFDDRINRIVKFIHENIDKQITIEQLAGLCCVEENYFIRIFKADVVILFVVFGKIPAVSPKPRNTDVVFVYNRCGVSASVKFVPIQALRIVNSELHIMLVASL